MLVSSHTFAYLFQEKGAPNVETSVTALFKLAWSVRPSVSPERNPTDFGDYHSKNGVYNIKRFIILPVKKQIFRNYPNDEVCTIFSFAFIIPSSNNKRARANEF